MDFKSTTLKFVETKQLGHSQNKSAYNGVGTYTYRGKEAQKSTQERMDERKSCNTNNEGIQIW